jgi:hypothetical protein
VKVTVQLRFSIALTVFLISCVWDNSNFFFCIFERLKGDSAVCVHYCCSWDTIVDVSFSYFSNILSIASWSAWLLDHPLWNVYINWHASSHRINIATPAPTPFSLFLPSVDTCIAFWSYCSVILTESAGWNQSFGCTYVCVYVCMYVRRLSEKYATLNFPAHSSDARSASLCTEEGDSLIRMLEFFLRVCMCQTLPAGAD